MAASPDSAEALDGRWREIGFDVATVHDGGETIRAPEAAVTTPSAGLITGAGELPRISVDLPSTMPGDAAGASGPRSTRPELEVRGVLGEGGMGRVYLARQRSLAREVALKTLRDRASAADVDALLAEGAVTGSLEHPGIIPVHALGVHHDGRPVLVMKRVEGVTWQELLADPAHAAWEGWSGRPEDRLEGHLEILMQVCNAAHFAHSRGVAHRDVKPANVLIGRFGDVYLADWGVAVRMTAGQTNRVCGTPAYMAPEMATGGVVDARTDVYLLGATLHEVLTGKPRHEGKLVGDLLRAAVLSLPYEYASAVPEPLAALATKATARLPGDRPESAAAFRRAIADFLRHRTSIGLSASALPRLARLREVAAEASDEAAREADGLVLEVRFALGQALEAWAENPGARAAQLELDGILEARRARAAELERLARDLDPRTASRQRDVALGGLTIAAVGAAVLALAGGIENRPSARELVVVSFLPLGVVIAVIVALRRHLAKTHLNRMTAGLILAMVSAITLGRALALLRGTDPSDTLFFELVLGAALSVFGAFAMYGWLAWAGAFLAACAVAAARWPGYAYFVFSMATSVVLLFGAVMARRVTRA